MIGPDEFDAISFALYEKYGCKATVVVVYTDKWEFDIHTQDDVLMQELPEVLTRLAKKIRKTQTN